MKSKIFHYVQAAKITQSKDIVKELTLAHSAQSSPNF